MSRRRSTIHDAAALRLHPNGVRVPLTTSEVRNPTGTVVTAKTKRPLLDAQGNWVASDAGGDARVTKRRRVEEGNKEGDDKREEVPVRVYRDARANRRVAFEKDFDFLAEPVAQQRQRTESERSLHQPSSDLLKCIHYFASQHYAASRQLFDSAAQYRKEKKEKRGMRMQQAETRTPSGNVVESEQLDSDDGSSRSKLKKGKGKTRRKRQTRAEEVQRDMYKAFDGSALLCIGMLLQSYIAAQLEDRKPNGWEDDISTSGDQENPDSKNNSDTTSGEA